MIGQMYKYPNTSQIFTLVEIDTLKCTLKKEPPILSGVLVNICGLVGTQPYKFEPQLEQYKQHIKP